MRDDLKLADKYSLILSWQEVTAFTTPSLRAPEKKKLIKNGKEISNIRYAFLEA